MPRSTPSVIAAIAAMFSCTFTSLAAQCRPVTYFGFHQEHVGASLAADGEQALFGHGNGYNCGHFEFKGDGYWRRSALMGGSGSGPVAMGSAVALRGDLALLGDGRDNSLGYRAGAAVVYEQSAGTWSRISDLYSPAPILGTGFGDWVAISSDRQRLLVAAPQDPANGALHIYTRQPTGWTLEQTIDGNSLTPSVQLAGPAALIQGHLFIGAASTGSGEVRVLTQVAGVWTQQTTLAPAQLAANAGFGGRIAADGSRLVVAAPNQPYTGSQDSGVLFVYDLAEPNWQSQPTAITIPTWTNSRAFGWAIDVCGDRIAVGARNEAFVFHRRPSGWRVLAWVVPPLNGFSFEFGRAVALFDHGLLVGDVYHDDDPWQYPDNPGGVHSYDLVDVGQPLQACQRGVAIQWGGNLRMKVNWPQQAGKSYQVFGSATGSGPTIINGVSIPLTQDVYTSVLMQNPAFFTAGFGVLDGNGQAIPEWVVPRGLPLSLAGIEFHHAVIAWDATSLAATNAVSSKLISIY